MAVKRSVTSPFLSLFLEEAAQLHYRPGIVPCFAGQLSARRPGIITCARCDEGCDLKLIGDEFFCETHR